MTQSPTRIIVELLKDDLRLDVYLHRCLPTISRNLLQRCIEEGAVLLNAKPARKKTLVKNNDVIELDEQRLRLNADTDIVAQNIPFEVLWEDEYCLAVNKPAGLVVHPGSGNRSGTLVNALVYHLPAIAQGFSAERPGIVHRLDKETSGVLLVAKTNVSHAAFADLFANRRVEKRYLGFCIGRRPEEHGSIEAALGRSMSNPVKRAVITTGKEAKTEYWLEQFRGGIACVRFRLHTGRTHQIRIHCSHAGFPIVADPLYGGGPEKARNLQPMDRQFAIRIFECFARHALHAHSLAFQHPFTQAKVTVVAPLPADIRNACDLMGVTEKVSLL
jgi:23S rRNA pseudouridine1911/1915/1917 synthase